jgi:hypothetical protein
MKRQASVGMFYLYTILIVIAVMAMASCSTSKGCNYKKVQKFNNKQMRKYHRHADNSIHNPNNQEFVVEVAFNEGVSTENVTQEMFDARY